MDDHTSRNRLTPQGCRQGWKSCLLTAAFFIFSACAEDGKIGKNIPNLPSRQTPEPAPTPISLEQFQLDKAKEDLEECQQEVREFKYGPKCKDYHWYCNGDDEDE